MDVSRIRHVSEQVLQLNEIDFLGFRITNSTFNDCIDYIDQVIAQNQVIKIVPVNANKLYQCRKNESLTNIIKEAAVILPEYAVVWGAKKLGNPLAMHIGGIMLMRRLLEKSRSKDYRFFFLGTKEKVLSNMISLLSKQYPGIQISGWHNGFFKNDLEIVQKIAQSGANILLVAMGTPKQEYFINKYFHNFNVNMVMGVGGSFDVFAGLRKETPRRWRKGFEWIYRLAQDPLNWGYWKRYMLTNSWFVFRVYNEKIKNRIRTTKSLFNNLSIKPKFH